MSFTDVECHFAAQFDIISIKMDNYRYVAFINIDILENY